MSYFGRIGHKSKTGGSVAPIPLLERLLNERPFGAGYSPRAMNDLRLLPVPALSDNYIWLLSDRSGAAIAVDPGAARPLRQALLHDGLKLRAILLTHHHDDHLGGVAELVAETGAQVYAPEDPRIRLPARRVGDGERLHLSEPALQFEVLAVPGHTRSHIAWYGHGLLFSGDTLFSVGCGRLFEGTPAQMLTSLDRLARLPNDTLICCAHEYTEANCRFALSLESDNLQLRTRAAQVAALRRRNLPSLPVSLGEELATNPFLRVDQPAMIAALDGDRTARFAELRRRKDGFKAPPA